MSISVSFNSNIERLDWRQNKIIVAVSGGLDSMSLALLFFKAKQYFQNSQYGLAGFDFVIAHCNFNLRGEESIADATFVKQWAEGHQIPYYEQSFDTPKIIETDGDNVQIVARQLRYEWFETLRKELKFDYIATAHHKQDSVETLLMNFFKGTGIQGLHGILPQKGRIIRPLLQYDKEILKAFALQENLNWREDVSNQKQDYLRNQVRLTLVPEIEKIFPNVTNALYQNTIRFGEVEALYNQSIDQYRKKLLEKRGKDFYIPLRKLIQCEPLATIVFELLKPFGLSNHQLGDALQLIHSDTGRFIDFEHYKLIKDRNFFIITPRAAKDSDHILIHQDSTAISTSTFDLKLASVKALPPAQQIEQLDAYIDKNLLVYPLILRPWKEGDYLYPFGMGLKKKKVKKILIDLKMPIHEKENIWVLESQKKIVWICGIRSDERFKVNKNTKEILHLHFKKRTV